MRPTIHADHAGPVADYRDVAVLVPCHDEAATVARVVHGFARALPGATVVVCDNASADGTADLARAAGARVITEHRPGKGFAVRRLFSDVEAAYYVLVDGDATYDPRAAPAMVAAMREGGVDTVLGVRRPVGSGKAEWRPGHQLGNAVFSSTFSRLFDTTYSDVLTGYRAFSRRFVKSCPLLARGFDVEIELNAHGASLGVPHAEVETRYRERPEGSTSKLSTWSDGARIFRRLLRLYRDFKPGLCFGLPGLLSVLVGLGFFVPVLVEFQETARVARYPTLFVAVGAMLAGLVLMLVSAILDRAARDRIERNRLAYLAQPSPGVWPGRVPVGLPPGRVHEVDVAGSLVGRAAGSSQNARSR